MSVLDYFIERKHDPGAKTKQDTKQTPQSTVQSPPHLDIPPSPTSNTDNNSPSLQKAMKYFDNVFKTENDKNHPGNDFYEFFVMKEAFGGGVPENTKYIAVFAALSAQGITKDKLISTANDYIAAIDREVENFGNSFKQEYDNQVTNNENLLKQKNDQIVKFSAQITQLNEEMKQLNQTIYDSKQTLGSSKNAFEEAGRLKKETFQKEIEKMNQYIS